MGNNQDKIDSYIRNELTMDETENLKKSLNSDLTLKSDYELTRLISKSLNKRITLYKLMSQWEKELEQNEQSKKIFPISIKKILIAGLGLAASVIIALFVIVPFYDSGISESNDNFAHNMLKFDSSDFMSDDYKMYTSQIDSLINISEYEKAMSIVNIIEKDFEFLNESHNDQLERASIEKSIIQDAKKYLNDAYALQWRKINLLVMLGNKQTALTILKMFKEEDGKYKEDAQKLYNELLSSR